MTHCEKIKWLSVTSKLIPYLYICQNSQALIGENRYMVAGYLFVSVLITENYIANVCRPIKGKQQRIQKAFNPGCIVSSRLMIQSLEYQITNNPLTALPAWDAGACAALCLRSGECVLV